LGNVDAYLVLLSCQIPKLNTPFYAGGMVSSRRAGWGAWRRQGWLPWQASRHGLRACWTPPVIRFRRGAGPVCAQLRGAPPRQAASLPSPTHHPSARRQGRWRLR